MWTAGLATTVSLGTRRFEARVDEERSEQALEINPRNEQAARNLSRLKGRGQ